MDVIKRVMETHANYLSASLLLLTLFLGVCNQASLAAAAEQTITTHKLIGELDGTRVELGEINFTLQEVLTPDIGLNDEDLSPLARAYFGADEPELEVSLEAQPGTASTGIFFEKPPIAKIKLRFGNSGPDRPLSLVEDGIRNLSLGQAALCDLFQGNPIHIGTGNKYQHEPLFSYHSPGRSFAVSLHYNSQLKEPGVMGHGWRHSFEHAAEFRFDAGEASIRRADGKRVDFVGAEIGATEPWQALGRGSDHLLFPDDEHIDWQTETDRQRFNSQGQLLRIADRRSYGQRLRYDDAGRLISVSDDFGARLLFSYDDRQRLNRITDMAGQRWRFDYDAQDNLSTLTRPDQSQRRYLYEDRRFPHHLTGIVDAEGRRYASFRYDDKGRGISSFHGEGQDKTDVTSIRYTETGRRRVNDTDYELGYVAFNWTIRAVKPAHDSPDSASAIQDADSCSGVVKRVYYPDGKLASVTDASGRETTYTGYDNEGRAGVITEAPRTVYQRSTAIEYHPTLKLPTRITRPGPNGETITERVYDARGNPLSITRVGHTPAGIEVKTELKALYDDLARPIYIDGPQPGDADTTQFRYYPRASDAAHTQARLRSLTTPDGQVYTILAYDAYGRVLLRQLPSGLIEEYVYDAIGRLTARHLRADQQIRSWQSMYDKSGLLVQTTEPGGLSRQFTYDGARKLMSITDARGNQTVLERNEKGRLIATRFIDTQGKLISRLQNKYDAQGRLSSTTNALDQTTQYRYDRAGRLTAVTDAADRTTRMHYDLLGRVEQIVDTTDTPTRFDYDIADNLSEVIDPVGVPTAYVYDGLGRRLQEDSQDRGTLEYEHDSAGNLVTHSDARGNIIETQYDSLNRPLTIAYTEGMQEAANTRTDDASAAQGADTIAFSYGKAGAATGRLTEIKEQHSTLQYDYTAFGELNSFDQSLADGPSITTHYHYDAAGRLDTTTLPDGKRLTYRYHPDNGDLQSIALDEQPLLSDISYHPSGAIAAARYGNGIEYRASYDALGRITSQTRGKQTISYGYDLAGNIIQQGHESYRYDDLDRLIGVDIKDSAANDSRNRIRYHYDANGNRTKLESGEQTTQYLRDEYSNRIIDIKGASTQHTAIHYDSAGNRIEDGRFHYHYNMRGRLEKVTDKQGNSIASYRYNALGLRTRKDTDKQTVFYVYNPNGTLAAEYLSTEKQTAQLSKQYLWLGTVPIAVLDYGQDIDKPVLHYLHADHLGTPRVATNQEQEVSWKWRSTPFGVGEPVQKGLELNLRFPGQYYDEETGLHYNWWRYYDPTTGRYIESDPIGLRGGINTYAYAELSPISFIDPFGLKKVGGRGGNPLKAGSGSIDCLPPFAIALLASAGGGASAGAVYGGGVPGALFGAATNTSITIFDHFVFGNTIGGNVGTAAVAATATSPGGRKVGAIIGGASTAIFSNTAKGSLPNATGSTLGGFIGGITGNFFVSNKAKFNLLHAGLKGGSIGFIGGITEDVLLTLLQLYQCEEDNNCE